MPPAGLLPTGLEVPSPTLRERSLPVVPAGTASVIPACRQGPQREGTDSTMAAASTDAVPGAPLSRPEWQGETPVSCNGRGPTAAMSEVSPGRHEGRGESAFLPFPSGPTEGVLAPPPSRPKGQGGTPASSSVGEPSIPWWESWFRQWGQTLAVAGAAVLVLVALRSVPRLPDQAPGGHSPAPAVSLLAQVQFLEPAEEPADLSAEGFPDALPADPADGQAGDPGEDPTGLPDPDLVPPPFGSAFDGSFEIVVTDPAADVSHEWSFLEMQETDYTFLDDSDKEESWSEESRG